MALEEYLPIDVETDPDVIHQSMIDDLRATLPGWEPADAAIENLLMAIFARRHAERNELLIAVTDAIYRAHVLDILGLPYRDATYAEVTSTWTAADSAGHAIEAGTEVAVSGDAGQRVGFRVLDDAVIPGGATVTATGAVTLQAVAAGSDGSGLPGPVEAVDSLPWLSSISLDGQITTGGRDAETEDEFMARTSIRLQVLSEAPILPVEFAILARDTEGVARALAIDGYKPSDGSTNNERTVTVAVLDEAGVDPPLGTRNAVDTRLQALREKNFLVYVIGANRTTIDVTFAATTYPGQDPAYVKAAAEGAVASYLNPATWGLPQDGDPGSSGGWIDQPVVRRGELFAALDRVDGLNYVTALTINGSSTADVTMTGPAAVAVAGTIAGTVTAP